MGAYARGVFAIARKPKYLVPVLLLAFAGGGLVLFGTRQDADRRVRQDSQVQNTRDRVADSGNTADSDQDGLKDWEEAIWHTDPEKSDSDGDGMTDGQEVAENRNPLKPGSNDFFLDPAELGAIRGAPGIEAGNLTFSFTKNLVGSGLLEALSSGTQISKESLVSRLALDRNFDPSILLAPAATVRPGDLPLDPRGGNEAVRAYANRLFSSYARNLSRFSSGDDLDLFVLAFRDGKREKLAGLDAIAASLRTVVTEMRPVPTPQGYRDLMAKTLNTVLQIARAVEILAATERDPLASLVILEKRIRLSEEFSGHRRALLAQLKADGVSFAPNDPAYAYVR